ncbi:universal stress protein [Georgenia ruanii]|nr:universal stress protein [Georgenia ruanii]MPV89756.1 universal stress protein [Georgenia ruanii]
MSSSSTPAPAPRPAVTPHGTSGVIVGFDGSDLSRQALAWAAEEAVRRTAPLHVVQVVPDLSLSAAYGIFAEDQPPPTADSDVAQAAEEVRAAHEGLAVTSQFLLGRPARELVRASLGAALVVVGAHGHGRLTGKLLGSVSQQVAAHAHSSVVIVRGGEPRTGPVVVGVDTSPGASMALDFALAHAARSGSPVLAVHAAYVEPGLPLNVPPGFWVRSEDAALEEEAEATAAAVDRAAERYPDVTVTLNSAREHPVEALLRAASGASLVVVGSRGLGGFTGLMLGSVSQGVLSTAERPVAVARTAR